MLRSGFLAFTLAQLCATPWAADATRPIDYTQRHGPFATGAPTPVAPEKQTPSTNAALQDRRFEHGTVEKSLAPVAGRRADLDVREGPEKRVHEKDSQRPERREQPVSAFDHRLAAISTAADTSKPPTVARYQESLAAASASNMARFPAIERASTAKINRFVFRKNPPDAAAALGVKSPTPAAGGSSVSK